MVVLLLLGLLMLPIDPVNLVLVVGEFNIGKLEPRLAGGTEIGALLAIRSFRHDFLGVNRDPQSVRDRF